MFNNFLLISLLFYILCFNQ